MLLTLATTVKNIITSVNIHFVVLNIVKQLYSSRFAFDYRLQIHIILHYAEQYHNCDKYSSFTVHFLWFVLVNVVNSLYIRDISEYSYLPTYLFIPVALSLHYVVRISRE